MMTDSTCPSRIRRSRGCPEPAEIPIALEVPEVSTPKIITMPVIEEQKEEPATAPVEQPAPAKKTRKKKVEKDTQTNEEKEK